MTTHFRFDPQPGAPIVCDFTGAPDTPEERFAEYHRLFQQALISRERTTDGVVLRFDGSDETSAWVVDLARREAACCPFMRYDVGTTDEGLRWCVTGAPAVQPILDEYYALYDAAARSVDELVAELAGRGFEVRTDDRGRWVPTT